ncbi:Peptidoglycan-binding LysM [hydrothermal vent metagenome]|uniref:Peptidoglycan-binding LysM n=1 Tax=hydrothermal vent metagenome TaxID=652676 RepID=A0A3B0YTI4_9ZZZZ
MKRILTGKALIPVVLALGLVAGCATTPAPKEEPAAKGPSAEVTQAINSAKSAIATAKSVHWIWRDTGKILKKAEAAAAKGDDATAIKLANKARSQAVLAVNQYYLEAAKVLYAEAGNASGLSADQQSTLNAAGAAIGNAEGRKAYDLLNPLLTELRAASIKVEVARGDSLWAISGSAEVYNNPYQWPLIYKANRDQIKDADLIYPGQMLTVDRNPSASEVAAAVDHARNRGAWSIGVVEESDREYLGGSLELK